MGSDANIWLVGMMGAGKSSVGPALAQRLGRPFLDTDQEVEREAGCSVAEIFAGAGEGDFRQRESRAIQAALGHGAVVALGGGALSHPGTRERLAEAGVLVYLRARVETLIDRVGDPEGRPLLKGLGPEAKRERLEDLLAQRSSAYESAQIQVDTDGISTQAVVDSIVERLEHERRARNMSGFET